MAVPLTGAGSLGVRLGHLFGGLADDLALQGFTATARVLSGAFWTTREGTIQTDYSGGTADIELVNGDNGFGAAATPLYQTIDSWNSTFQTKFTAIGQLAANTIIKMCDRDAGGLLQRTLPFALSYLINQMTIATTTFQQTTVAVGAQTSLGSPVGNATLVVSALNGLGQTIQYAFSETLTATCIADSYTGSATKNQEQLTVAGQASVQPSSSYLWPAGSGQSKSINATDPTKYNQGASINLLTNGDFATFTTTNNPDNWTITVGVVTTNFAKVTSPVYFGSNSLKIIGDSATLAAINQSFNTTPTTTVGAGGTNGNVVPQTVYCANLFYQLSAGSPAAGVLALEVVDGGNTIIQNSQAVNQTVNKNLNTVADTNWHALPLVFSLPAAQPTLPVKLRIRLSTALTTGTNVFIAGVSCTPMTCLYGGNAPYYSGGPMLAAFAGSTALLKADAWTFTFVPTWGVFQQYFERLFGMKGLGQQFPSSGSPTVADSLIV